MTSDWLHANDVNMGEHAKLVSWSQAIIGYIITDRQIDTFLQISTFFGCSFHHNSVSIFLHVNHFEVETNERKRSVQSGAFSFEDRWGGENPFYFLVPQPIDVDKSSRNARKSVWGWVIPFPRPITPPRNPRSRVLKSWKNLNFEALYKGWWD